MTDPPSTPGPDLHVDAPPKPCARRIVTQAGTQTWCQMPEGHVDECLGVTPRELPGSDLGPRRRPQWGR